MKSKELCEMCAEYSAETKCEYKKECKLQSILTENERLKHENRKLKKEQKNMKQQEDGVYIQIQWESRCDV